MLTVGELYLQNTRKGASQVSRGRQLKAAEVPHKEDGRLEPQAGRTLYGRDYGEGQENR